MQKKNILNRSRRVFAGDSTIQVSKQILMWLTAIDFCNERQTTNSFTRGTKKSEKKLG